MGRSHLHQDCREKAQKGKLVFKGKKKGGEPNGRSSPIKRKKSPEKVPVFRLKGRDWQIPIRENADCEGEDFTSHYSRRKEKRSTASTLQEKKFLPI